MKWLRDESGQTLVTTALASAVLIGFMGLAIDVGVLFRAQRKVQTAADAAAIAGALEYYYHGSTNAASVAKTAASNNGITDTNQVAVNIPPVNGWHTGASFIEVIITQPNPTIFFHTMSNIMGANNFGLVNVDARAVGGIVPGKDCMISLNPTADDALDVQGGAGQLKLHPSPVQHRQQGYD
jgi:hypothetical protein